MQGAVQLTTGWQTVRRRTPLMITRIVTNTIHEECQEEPNVSYAHVTQALLSVCLGKAVVDTACTATVCGLKWLVDFLKRLPSELEKQVKTLSTCRSICFGDNQPEKSLKRCSLPIFVAGNVFWVETEVVNSNVPLLFGLPTLFDLNANINISKRCLTLNGLFADITISSTGHMLLEILPKDSSFLTTGQLPLDTAKVEKLHKQFGHCSVEKLADLSSLAYSDIDRKASISMVEPVVKACENCQMLVCNDFRL